MIVPDINLLVYAYNSSAPRHAQAKYWWERMIRGEENVGIPWVVSMGFIRLMSSRSAVTEPMSPPEAAKHVMDWLRHHHVKPLNPGERHMEYLQRNLAVPGSGTNLVTDAHIAALAMEADAELHTSDTDFAKFAELRWHNPLA